MNQFLHLIPANGWRVRIYDPTTYKGPITKDVVAFALRKDGVIVPLTTTSNDIDEVPIPTPLVDVCLLGPSDEDSSELPQRRCIAESPSKAATAQTEPHHAGKASSQTAPKDTRPLEIQIFAQIDSAEREIDRGMDIERLICRCHGDGDIRETIQRLYDEHLIFVDPRDHRGCDFYRLTDKAKAKLCEFERNGISEGIKP